MDKIIKEMQARVDAIIANMNITPPYEGVSDEDFINDFYEPREYRDKAPQSPIGESK